MAFIFETFKTELKGQQHSTFDYFDSKFVKKVDVSRVKK